MNQDKEWTRLAAMYAEQSDAQLLALHPDDLTDVAQQALAQVMKERGLAAKAQPAAAVAADPADLAAEGLNPNEAVLYVFDDAFQANEAIRVLDEVEIPHRMANWNRLTGKDAMSRYGFQLALIVDQAEIPKAAALLHDKLGLDVPAASGDTHEVLDALDDMTVVVLFEREQLDDALAAAEALGRAGISFLWRDAGDAPEGLPDAETISLEVRAASLERAQHVLDSLEP